MLSTSAIVQALAICFTSYCAWRFLRPLFVKSHLWNIPGPPKDSLVTGNLHQIFNRKGWDFHHSLHKKYGSVVKIYGFFGDEQLYVSDPRALHHVVIKDQYIYEETSSFIASNNVIFGTSLLSTLGAHHRKQRKMLNPVFSIRHMRDLIDVFYPIAHKLRAVLKNQVADGEKELNVMMWMSRAALEYIGQGGLGYSFDTLNPNKTNTYSETIKTFNPAAFNLVLLRQVAHHIVKLGPAWFRRVLATVVPSPAIHRMKSIVDIMDQTSRDIFNEKKKALEEGEESVVRQVGMGKDIMSILLRANLKANDADKLPEEELLGQMNTFIFAGHDTTTSAISRILWVLVNRPEAQEKLRAEVTAARRDAGGDLDYDTLMGLPYLDAVCRETLRLYPPASFMSRTTRKDVVMPLSRPIPGHLTPDRKPIHEILVKANTNVIISILGANRDKETWGEDAEEWNPERWIVQPGTEVMSDGLNKGDKERQAHGVAKQQLPGVYSGMMTFLGGSRACIGFKFAEMEMKLVLSIILETFKFSPGKEVYWNMSSLQSPVVVGSKDNIPELPLKVSLVKDAPVY